MHRHQNSAKKLLASFVIIGSLCSIGATCRTAPPRQVLCVTNFSSVNPLDWYADCYDTGLDDDGFSKKASDMDKYVCRSDEDEQILEDWIKRVIINCGKAFPDLLNKFKLPIDKIHEKRLSK